MSELKKFFSELFEYNNHFNKKLVQVFAEHPKKTSEKSVKLFSHIINAHHIWNCRIEKMQPRFGVWEIHQPQAFSEIISENHQTSINLISKNDFDAIIQYSNTKGQLFNNTIRDILFHILNHSTYHRAQIATEYKQSGLEPLVTDYIFYKR